MVKHSLDFKLPEAPNPDQLDLFRPRDNAVMCRDCAHSTVSHRDHVGDPVLYCWDQMSFKRAVTLEIECPVSVRVYGRSARAPR